MGWSEVNNVGIMLWQISQKKDHLPHMILDHQAFDDVSCWMFGLYSVDGWGSHGRDYYSECFYYAIQNGS